MNVKTGRINKETHNQAFTDYIHQKGHTLYLIIYIPIKIIKHVPLYNLLHKYELSPLREEDIFFVHQISQSVIQAVRIVSLKE